jgi:DNA-directed RNA polymerase
MQELTDLPIGALVPLDALDRQRRWEVEGVNHAIRRFRELEASKELNEQASGRSALRDVVPRLVTLLEAAQRDAIEGLANPKRGRPPGWWWYLGLLPADQLAVLVVVNVLSHAGRASHDRGGGQKMTSLASALARSVRLQAEFGQWVIDERAKTKDAKGRGEAYNNLYECLRRNARKIDRKAVQMWFRRIGKMRDQPWPEDEVVQFAALLVKLLVKAAGGWFETVLIPLKGGKTQRQVRLTELGRRGMEDFQNRAESGQAYHMPMLCPPQPWSYECPKDKPSTSASSAGPT